MTRDEIKDRRAKGVEAIIMERAPDMKHLVEEIRAARLAAPDKLTAHLRRELGELAGTKAKDLPAPARDLVQRWIDALRVENLAEWLEAPDNWQKVDGKPSLANAILDSLQECYTGQPSFNLIADVCATTEPDPLEHNRNSITITSTNYQVRLTGDNEQPQLSPDPDKNRELQEIHNRNFPRAVEWMEGLRLCIQEREWRGLLDTNKGARLRWIGLLARPWLEEQIAEQAEQEQRRQNAKPLRRVPRTKVGEREFVRIDKIGAGISWAFGGHGVPLASVDLDGKTFAPQADLAVVPAGLALLPADHANKSHQTVLALDDSGNPDAPPLAVAIASATQYAISLPAAKLAILIMAGAISKKQPTTKTTIRELAQRLNPALNSHKLRPNHYQTVFRSLEELSRQYIYFPNGFKYQAFFSALTWRDLTPAEYDHEILVGITPIIQAAIASYREKNTSYKGQFLLELTGALALDRGGPLRQYVRAAAAWNSYWKHGGEPDPAKVPTLSTEHWASLTNYLPPAAVEYLRTRKRTGSGHVRAAESVKKILEDAQELEASGLVVIDKANRDEIRLLPPQIYIEAWRKSKEGGEKAAG